MAWLEPLLSERVGLAPEARAVAQAFGRRKLMIQPRAADARRALGRRGHDPEVRLKRDLWDGLLREAYGDEVGDDSRPAAYLPDHRRQDDRHPRAGPAGRRTRGAAVRPRAGRNGILGAVEADFFDWPLQLAGRRRSGAPGRPADRALPPRDVEADVLKVLYESLVDPDERHDLGEILHAGLACRAYRGAQRWTRR